MKAIVINEPGGPDQLVIEEVPDPGPGPADLLVDVSAAGLNYLDTYHRTGLYQVEYPMTPGVDGAGVVAAVGQDVTGFAVGDRVAWPWVLGSYAERHVVPVRWAVALPDSIDDGTAVAAMVTGLTAHYLATDTFPLSPGDRCLIHAGAGGVGLLLTQLAKVKGAEVITTAGSDEKAAISRAAGADTVIVYTRDDFKTAVEDEYGSKPLDVVYDGVGAATFEASIDLLRPRGMMVTFGNASGPVPEISPLLLSRKGSLFLTRPTMPDYLRTPEELMNRASDLFDWIANGQIQPKVGDEFALADAAEAHRVLESRKTTGKVVLRP